MRFWVGCMIAIVVMACSGKETYEVVNAADNQSAEVDFDSCRADQFNAYFKKKYRKRQFNGTVLLAHGDSVFRASYGWANYRKRDSLQINTTFQLASVSKPITALVILQLVELGQLSLHDTLGKFFPDWPYPGVTIKHLLNHRSGLGNYLYLTDEMWEDKSVTMCNQEAVKLLIDTKPEIYYPLDKRFDYCNTNYMLLASIVEVITGMSFETYMATHFFTPLGMKTAFIKSDMDRPTDGTIATGHDKRMRTIQPFYLNGTVGDKGVYASVDDLFVLHKQLTAERVISDSLYKEMITPQSPFNRRKQSYALGWRLRELPNGEVITYHNGWWRGFRTYFIHLPQHNATLIALSNSIKGKFLSQDELLTLLLPSAYDL